MYHFSQSTCPEHILVVVVSMFFISLIPRPFIQYVYESDPHWGWFESRIVKYCVMTHVNCISFWMATQTCCL